MTKKNSPKGKPATEQNSSIKVVDGVVLSNDQQQKLDQSNLQKSLIVKTKNAVIPQTNLDPLHTYLKEVAKYDLLTLEEEIELTKEFKETGDLDLAKRLVQANLRLVVKIAMEYRSAYKNVLDLIQEGNIGLMKAVSLYDPEKGAKLSYYASWWIKSYILKFLLDNFRLVKIGTTAEQKKLFYNLSKERERLESMGLVADNKALAGNLGVSEKAVALMDYRLSQSGGEVSLDTPVGEDGRTLLGDILEGQNESVDEILGHKQELEILQEHLGSFLAGLKERDREIFKQRLLSDIPPSLQSIADSYGVTRERVRQIEERLINKLREYMSSHL